MAPDAPARRFAPEPVETSSKSSRPNGDKAPRKFAVEPVESTSKSSSKSKSNGQEQPGSAAAPKRFAPQPVETIARSNRKAEETTANPKSRFLPQPVETSAKSNRRNACPEEPTSPKSNAAASTEKPARRQFAPQLIDTSARTRKATDSGSVLLPTDKTDITPGINRPSHHNSGQTVTPYEATSSPADHPRFLLPFERRLERSDSRNSARTHSFRLPDLETIESSESENSLPPSLSNSPSSDDSPLASSNPVVAAMYKHATRIRESVDENFAHYLLELEARRAEQKLQEQALAAFPNSDFHEPVQHYVDEDDESEEAIDDRPATWEGHDEEEEMSFPRRRSSTRGSNWEMREMQQHHERLEQERKAAGTTKRKESSTPSPWWNPAAHDFTPAEAVRDPEMGKMLDRARPPMLGSELQFPRSASPEPARFDVTQGSSTLRSQMCYLTEQLEGPEDSTSPDGLWGQKKQSTNKSAQSTRSSASQAQGLWGGFCVDDGESKANGGLMPPTGPTGLLTPRVEPGNPFESMSFQVPESVTLPMTPPGSGFNGGSNPIFNIDGVLNNERELDELMERDYPDTFVTQVYNYLSLGYPTLARPFDEELSKISHIPISDLRHDDVIAKDMPKGYIRLGDDFEGRGDGTDQLLQDGGCARWKALKLYITEWARQEKDMVKTEGLGGNWGTGARRGSWAW